MTYIRQIWASGLNAAFESMSELVQLYPYITVRAVFAGVPVNPIVYDNYAYRSMKDVVDFTSCLQIAFAFADASGHTPSGHSCFQFNFKFCERTDIVLEAVLDVCTQTGFKPKFAELNGIEMAKFGEAILDSGLLINSNVYWVTYHGAHDLGYIVKAVSGRPLPETYKQFINELNLYFPAFYDVRQMLYLAQPKLDLPTIAFTANCLNITNVSFLLDRNFEKRAGNQALLIAIIFFKTLQLYYNSRIDETMHKGVLFGIDYTPQQLAKKSIE